MNVSDVRFVEKEVNGKYKIQMPEYLAEWDAWPNWERERFESMEKRLKVGDVLFDLGCENGAISCIYAGFVGGENVCLFEGTPEFWPNIMHTWERNGLQGPKATCNALVGDKISYDESFPPWSKANVWPQTALSDELTGPRCYRYIHNHASDTSQITLDRFCEISGIYPKAITVDIDGAELLAMRGAEFILRNYKPLVWVSLHPDFEYTRFYYETTREFHEFMTSCGYRGTFLGKDHEEHWEFEPCN